jgi:hypothetical protein
MIAAKSLQRYFIPTPTHALACGACMAGVWHLPPEAGDKPLVSVMPAVLIYKGCVPADRTPALAGGVDGE